MQSYVSAQKRLRMAVIGTGTWGKNWVRVLQAMPRVDLAWIVDPAPATLAAARTLAPAAVPVSDVEETGYDFQAAVLSTPSADHAEHAASLLKNGKHLLVEKPLAMDARTASGLIELATMGKVQLMTGHQLLYHPVYTRLQSMVSEHAVGELRTITAERTGPTDIRREQGVLWSYGPHDVAMILDLVRRNPVTVTARGQMDTTHPNLPATAVIDLTFEGGMTAQIRLAASNRERRRRLRVIGTRGTLTFDDTRREDALALVHTPGDPSAGGHPIPVKGDEPLLLEAAHFVECVLHGRLPRSGTAHALQVTKVLEKATVSFSARA